MAKGHRKGSISCHVGSRAWVWKIMNGCECYTNVRNPQDNDTDYNMGITVSVPGERVPRKRYSYLGDD